MPSLKRLSSVCHSMAHHSASSLSYIHPHLGYACEKSGKRSAVINLLSDNLYPNELIALEPLSKALEALRAKFIEVLRTEGFSPSELAIASLLVEFHEDFNDYWPMRCTSVFQANNGKAFAHAVNRFGESVIPAAEASRAVGVVQRPSAGNGDDA